MSLTRIIKEEALRLGFSLAGVTSPDPPPHGQAFQEWLSMGRHATMTYLTDERRFDPRRVMADCRSILVLAAKYPNPRSLPETKQAQPTGRIAAYAWGADYHLLLITRLEALVAFIEKQVGQPVPHKIYTDTGPLLERDLAQRAGLGWIGKNTCLIHPKMGSTLLLAEILLGISLDEDEPFTADHCGTCNRCLSACPTACILPNRTLDARLCISYLTIENKGEIPEALRNKMGKWIFGCDVCQQVCPWNELSQAGINAGLFPVEGRIHPQLMEEMDLTPDEFNRKFHGSPILRSKRPGYLRNVAVALGNCGNSAVLPVLEKACRDPHPLISSHAAWALKQIQSNIPSGD